ncbi:MAG: hypothetical protein V2A76_14440 [Planctomycetota bacterium]
MRIGTATLLFAIFLFTQEASSQQLGPEGRRPEGGVADFVQIEVPWTALLPQGGRNQRSVGRLKFWKSEGPHYAFATDLPLPGGDGRTPSPEEGLTFRLNKQGDAFGAGADLEGPDHSLTMCGRLLAKSDFALLPLRMLFPHEMPASSGGRPSERTLDHEEYQVLFEERFAGVETISYTPLRSHDCRTVRTLLPSGFQLVDYTLTYEDERDETVMAGFGIRMLVHDDKPLPDGRTAPSGIFHFSVLRTHQLDWMRETTVIPVKEWDRLYERWMDRLPDRLFTAIQREAIGNPFCSPAAFALRVLNLLDESSLHRLASHADARTLSAVAPHLLDRPIAFDPSPFLKAWETADDPVRRLLLAAAVAATGSWQPRFVTEAEIGLHSRDRETVRAALLLAASLGKPLLIPALARVAREGAAEDLKIRALSALGITGGSEAADAILAMLAEAPSRRLRAAALSALASTGENGLETFFDDGEACFGAIDPATGLFELLLTDGGAASDALSELSKLAAAARGSSARELAAAFKTAFAGEESEDPGRRGLAFSATGWSVRLGAHVRELGSLLDDAELGRTARRLVRGSGRTAVAMLLPELAKARGAKKKALAVLLGSTRDPRARELLLALRDSDNNNDSEAGDAGFDALRRED